MLRRRPAMFVLLLALAACGGGGGTSTLPAGPISPPAGSGGSATSQNVTVSIAIPSASASSGIARRPQYISASTQSAAISVNGGTPVLTNLSASSSTCTTTAGGRTCTVSVNAPVGSDTFAETLYATTNGTGAVLSQGKTAATIAAGTANTVLLTLNGVPASVVLTLATATPPQGTADPAIGLTVTINDAAGRAIISDPFSTPIALTDSDKSGATSISATTLNSPADAANLTVSYSGAALSAPAVFGATGTGLVSVSSATLTPQSTNTTVTFNDYTTYGFDNQRTIFNPNSTAITPSSLPGLHLAWQATLGAPYSDYNTQTQPMIATNIPGHAAVVFVGGSGLGNMYAYDGLTGALLWTKGLGVEQYTCNETQPGPTNFGIGGTAAYDPSSKSLYVVGNYNTAPNAQGQNTLWHLDAATGQSLGSVNFSPNNIGPSELDFSHVSVNLSNGVAYVGTAATCDISSWRGRVVAISVPSMSIINTAFTVWNGTSQPWGGGGIWGWGGVSLDFNGNVLTGVGNTDNGTTAHGSIVAPFVAAPSETSGNGDAFIALSSNLSQVLAANHPINNNVFGSNGGQAVDLDLNGTPVIMKPNGVGCDTVAAVQGKSGGLYLYDTTRINAGPLASYQLSVPSYNDEFIGNPSYSPVTGLIYSPIPVGQGTIDPPGMIAINPGCGTPSIAWSSTFGPDSDTNGGGVARSAPAASAGGVVFVGTPCFADATGGCTGDLGLSVRTGQSSTRKPLICCNPPSSNLGGAVWAVNAATGAVLNGGKPILTTPGILRMPPTIDGNWLYVLDNGGDLYGMTIDTHYAAISSKYRSVDARSRQSWGSKPSASKT